MENNDNEMEKIIKETEEKAKKEAIIAQVGKMLFLNCTLDRVDKNIIEQCKGFPNCSLYLFGPIRAGKTFAAIAIGRRYSGFTYKRTSTLLRELRSCEKAWQEQELLNSLINSKILILDDLGAEKLTEFTLSFLNELIDFRSMINPNGLIITSNYSIQELGKIYEARLAGRILEMCRLVELPARKIKAKGEK
jgi:DNA replication protein DnaC